MKWILLSAVQNNPDIAFIQKKLSQYQIECSLVSSSATNFYTDPAAFFAQLEPVTHCIFLDSGKGFEDPSLSFLLGFMSGREVPVFLCGTCTVFLEKALPAQLSCFSSAAEMVDLIIKQLPQFMNEEKRRNAYNKLFTSGIPFTADSFAFNIAKNNTDECILFRDAGMDLNSRDSNGTPMLCIAARKDCKEMVEWLLNNGADIDAVSADRGYSPVMDAVWRSNTDVTKLLVERGANLNFISKEGQSVLVLAVGNGNADICKMLIDHGANPNVKDQMGMSAKEYAMLFKKPAILEAFNNSAASK